MSVYARRYPQMDKDQTRKALHMLQTASYLMRDLEKLFASHGLSQTRFLILIVLEREGGALTGAQVRELIDISRPVLTRTLQGLKREGFVAIDPSQEDARAHDVRLTAEGAKKLAEVLPEYFALIRNFMSDNPSGRLAETCSPVGDAGMNGRPGA